LRLLLAAIVTGALALAQTSAFAVSSQTTISGGGITQALRLTPIDETALFQRISLPPKLDNAPPSLSGPSYTVQSPYWPMVLPGNGKDRPAALDEAAYYPNGGFARASQGGKDAWLALDLRQRAILDRYVSLGEKHLIAGEPSIIEVLRADVATGDQLAVSVGVRDLTQLEQGKLWTALEGVNPRSFPPPGGAPATPDVAKSSNGIWITFLLPEGRDARLLYAPSADVLVDYAAQQYYPLPKSWLTLVLGPDGQPGSGATAATPVPQERGPGSPLWWPLMIGAGVALLALAVFLNRTWARDKARA
jgi:hypothetical protein